MTKDIPQAFGRRGLHSIYITAVLTIIFLTIAALSRRWIGLILSIRPASGNKSRTCSTCRTKYGCKRGTQIFNTLPCELLLTGMCTVGWYKVGMLLVFKRFVASLRHYSMLTWNQATESVAASIQIESSPSCRRRAVR